MDKNRRKLNRKSLIIIFFFITVISASFLVLIFPVKAVYSPVKECDPKLLGANEKYVLFVYSKNKDLITSENGFPPAFGQEYCVKIPIDPGDNFFSQEKKEDIAKIQNLLASFPINNPGHATFELHALSLSQGKGCILTAKTPGSSIAEEIPIDGMEFQVSPFITWQCPDIGKGVKEMENKKFPPEPFRIVYLIAEMYPNGIGYDYSYLFPMGLYGGELLNQSAIDWDGTDKEKIVYGEKKEIVVMAWPSQEFNGKTLTLECLNCHKEWSAVATAPVSGGKTKIVITFDSVAYIKEAGSSVPAALILELKGSFLSPKGNLYSTYKFQINIEEFNCSENKTASECGKNTQCFFFGNKCESKHDKTICKELPKEYCAPSPGGSVVCSWNESTKQCLEPVASSISKQYGVPTGYKGPLPPCAFSGTCDNVNDLLTLIINQGKNIFGLIGIVALAAFVYGGFTMLFSFGNAEKTKKGRDILIAAVVGLVIAFSAYLLVNFLLDALGVVSSDFRAIK